MPHSVPRASRPCVALLLLCLLASRLAAASETRRVVFVTHSAAQRDSSNGGVLRALQGLQGQLGELALDIRTAHSQVTGSVAAQATEAAELAARSNAAAVFWFVPAANGILRVYVLHVPSGRVFERPVTLAGSEAMQREQLAIVLRAAVPAVLQRTEDLGEPLLQVAPTPARGTEPSVSAAESSSPGSKAPTGGTTTAPATPFEVPVDPPAAVELPQPNAPGPLRIAVGYSGALVSTQVDWQSGLSAEMVLDLLEGTRLGVGAGYEIPVRIHVEGASAMVTRIPLTARVGAGTELGRAGFGVEAGVSAEAWHRRTQLDDPELEATPDSTRWRMGVLLGGRAELALTDTAGLYLLAEVQWLPGSHSLSVQGATATQELTTAAFRPHVGVGITVDLPWQNHDAEGE